MSYAEEDHTPQPLEPDDGMVMPSLGGMTRNDSFEDVFAGVPQEASSPSADDDSAEHTGRKVPYITWKTQQTLMARIDEEGLPQVFDISYFHGQSGSMIAQIRSALKTWGLIDDAYKPTSLFKRLVLTSGEDRVALLRAMGHELYKPELELGTSGTLGQLQEIMRHRGLRSPDTINKAILFFLSWAEHVGVAVSPNFKRKQGGRRAPTNGRKKASRVPRMVSAPDGPLRHAVDHNVPATTKSVDQQRTDYVDMLMGLVKDRSADGSTPLETTLLDRIERALRLQETERVSDPG